ncbi:GNAT family N-acetyltransferase [Flavivirga rizhaonensis]|uniref:GNAT family N-acetyltransferase n=1 Tax=Flavivirga rizhaonensis TaxID=2559571 RepID=A0A4S1E082_9FLAO|nr:GNAT family N-acetyltransferase [Flavivirga rizhaonensis]TGV03937.1 GNAT family N-acetyltransferase [Flavivirga rizhaonensis]
MSLNTRHTQLSFFLDIFFKENRFPFFYIEITNSFFNKVIYKVNPDKKFNLNFDVYSIRDVPNYLVPKYIKNKHLKCLTAPLFQGYLINLMPFKNIEDYFDNKLGKPRKSQLKRYKKRLDLCITPEYKIFYGKISKNEYDHIFKELVLITERRFAQKKELNFELPYLELYQSMMYPLVLDKKASIFVIYHENKPINITLNFIDDVTIYHWNSCYDIDYQMFNLGHINMVNHLEWAFKNGFKLFDMGRGDFLHKRKYVNESYMYNEHIIYNSKSSYSSIIAHLKILKLKTRYTVIQFLKKFNLHLWYGYYAKYKYKIIESKNVKPVSNMVTIDNDIYEIPKLENLVLIDINDSEYAFLIKSLNYFLHKNQEFFKNVNIYMDKENEQTYYFSGIKKNQKIIILK